MLNSVMLSGILLFSGQPIDFPEVWKKIQGKWSYVGQVKEKTQILVWIEKKTKTSNRKKSGASSSSAGSSADFRDVSL